MPQVMYNTDVSKLIFLLYVFTASLALITVKFASKNGLPLIYTDSKLSLNLNPYTVIGFLLYGLSFVLYIYLISKFDLGYIIPLATGFVYFVIFIASFLIFHEAFTLTKIAGISLITAGIVLLNLNK
jgi:small multidrug resistance pump